LLDALRRATAAAHGRLEARLPVGRSNQTIATYRATLEALYGIYLPLEARLGVHAESLAPLRWEPRRKVHLLRADLVTLGVTAAQIDALPQCSQVPAVPDAPAALGCLYVVEGATLGGRVLSRRLRPLGISPRRGGRFFHGYGEETGPMWVEFVERLQASRGERYEDEEARTVQSAVELFDALEVWLRDRQVLA
jgi:heme oxygenase (biliverdin-IX-beta and delta-forming)